MDANDDACCTSFEARKKRAPQVRAVFGEPRRMDANDDACCTSFEARKKRAPQILWVAGGRER
jgi:hypothetical protein